MSVRDEVLPIFSSLLEMNSESVAIKKANSNITFGSLPEVYCSMFDYYLTMKCGKFKEATDDNKVFTLLATYTDDQCHFFVNIVPRLFFHNLKLTYQELTWLMKFFDDFLVNDEIAESCFQKIHVYSNDKILLLNYIIEQIAGKQPGRHITKLLQIAINDIQLDSISQLGNNLFTYAFGRNIVIQILKNDKYSTDETKLFLDLVNKVKEINSNLVNFKVSEKAFYDFLSCCRWFYIDKRKVVEKLEELTYLFPNFKITTTMEKAFTRRVKLVESYDNVQGTFKYNMKIHGNLDARDCYSYSQKVYSGSTIKFYCTGKYPELVNLYLSIKTKKRSSQKFIMIKNEKSDRKLLIEFELTETDNSKIIEKKWSFNEAKPLYIPYDKYSRSFIFKIKKAIYI